MANAFQQFLQGQQASMQQGQNLLAQQQTIDKLQKDRELRNILSKAYEAPQAAIPAMGAAPAMGPMMPGETLPAYPAQSAVPARAGGLNVPNALNAMYQGGFGPEAMAFEQKQATLGGTTPSAVNEYLFMKGLPKDEQEQFLAVKRAQKYLDIGSGYVAPSQVSPTAPPAPVVSRDLKPTETPEYLAEKSQKQKEAQVTGEVIAKAQTTLPQAELQVEQTTGLIDSLLSHPGLESSFGVKSYAPVIRGTERAGFESQLNQLKNTVFISNREALKGGGAITDFEGTKAEEAALRANQAQSPEEFKKALADYQKWVNKGFENLKRAGKGDFSIKEATESSGVIAPQAAIDYLKKNNTPAIQQQFKAKYGYLP